MKKDINFLKAYRIQEKYGKGPGIYTMLFVLVIVAAAFTNGILYFYATQVDKQSSEAYSEVERLKEAVKYDHIVLKKSEYEDFKEYNTMTENAKKEIEGLPTLSLTEYGVITKHLKDDMYILSLDFSGESFSVRIAAASQKDVPQYVSAVKREDIFKYVTYDGHAKESNITDVITGPGDVGMKNRYVFTITCLLYSEEKNETE